MLSYNNDPSTKADHVSLSILHAEGDRLSSGSYGNTSTGIGCSVGCHAMDYGLRNDDHAGLAKHIGWPEWLVRLQGTIFQGLPETGRGAWHVALAEAVPVGVDLTKAYHRICARMLREVSWPKDRPDDQWGCAVAVRRVAELHEASTAAWSAASAAEAAVSAAGWAARSAAWAAESAARSAAWSAESAAWSAESAARSAAWSSESAARSAAMSAARSAESDAYRQIRDIILAELSAAEAD